MHPIIENLKERKLVQWALAYLAGAWVVVQVVETFGPRWGLPDGAARGIDVLLVIGFAVTLVLAWYHGERGRQRVSGAELLIIGALLGIAGLLLTLLTTDGSTVAPRASAGDARPSVAVLPFETLGGSEEDAAFAGGMHDELLHRLARIGSLRVTSRTSVVGIRDQFALSREIAETLNVDHLVEGTFQSVGDQIRVIVQLIDPQSDDHLWSETFTRTLTVENIFAMQSEITAAIAQQLAAELTPEERVLIADQPTDNLDAYEAFQRAMAHWDSRLVPANRLSAIDEFEEAVELDPDFIDARASHARALALDFWFGQDSAQAHAAWRALEDAIARDSTRASVHVARGDLHYYTMRDYETALAHYSRALELEPGNADAIATVGLAMRRQGRFDESIEYLERSLTLNPRSAYHMDQLARAYRWTRRGADAVRWWDRALAVRPANDSYRALRVQATLCLLQDPAEALRLTETDEWRDDFRQSGQRGFVKMMSGNLTAAQDEPGLPPWLFLEDEERRAAADSVLQTFPATDDLPFDLSGPYLPQAPGRLWYVRAQWEARAGNATEARRLGERAAVLTYDQDALENVIQRGALFDVYRTIGDLDAALEELEFLLGVPSAITAYCARRDPENAVFEGNPRFEEILREAEGR